MAQLIDLVQRVVTRLSMVAGPAVQLFAEDRIAEMLYHKFVVVRDELWWDDLMHYAAMTLGADGRPVENVVRFLPTVPIGDEIVINKYTDVQYIWPGGARDPLPTLPRRANITTIGNGGRPLYKAPDAVKVFRVFPSGEGTQILVRYKQYVPFPKPDDVLPMDEQVLILGTCYDYLEDDGSNPSQIEKFRVLFQQRLDRLKAMENDEEIPLGPVGGATSDYQVVA